jgi:hypothetical protein
MKEARKPSGINVEPLVLDKILAIALEKGKVENPDIYNVEEHYPIARIITAKGVFVVDKDGVGVGPLGEYVLYLYCLYNKDGQESIDCIPKWSFTLKKEDIMNLPVLDPVPLENWIRTFGNRLEHNYADWVRALTK